MGLNLSHGTRRSSQSGIVLRASESPSRGIGEAYPLRELSPAARLRLAAPRRLAAALAAAAPSEDTPRLSHRDLIGRGPLVLRGSHDRPRGGERFTRGNTGVPTFARRAPATVRVNAREVAPRRRDSDDWPRVLAPTYRGRTPAAIERPATPFRRNNIRMRDSKLAAGTRLA